MFGGAKPTPPLFNAPPSQPSPFKVPAPKEPSVEAGMQAECMHLFATLAKELEDLRALAQQVSGKTAALSKSTGATPGGVTFSDIGRLKQKVKDLEKDLAELRTRKKTYRQSIHELESNLLKGTTKREEIARFSRASSDPEFAKALRIRSLGPEYTETQSQLRRNIRALRDRIEKLEDHIKSAKKRVREYKTGKPALRAPSLDTIHRTYRNIDTALDQQAIEIASLASRVANLKLDSRGRRLMLRRLPSDTRGAPKKPANVAPNVAVATAAALNAERSAQRLKRALLAVRKEPLLNRQAVEAPALVETRKKEVPLAITGAAPLALGPPKPFDLGPLPQLELKAEPVVLPEWSLPPLDDSGVASPSHRERQRGVAGKYHMKSAPLKKSPAPAASASPPVKFDWGPLPGVQPKAMLSADVRPEGAKGKERSASPAMEGSWVLDGFQGK